MADLDVIPTKTFTKISYYMKNVPLFILHFTDHEPIVILLRFGPLNFVRSQIEGGDQNTFFPLFSSDIRNAKFVKSVEKYMVDLKN